ncbi:MAG: carboxypeptidase-like regulatory domain-containing protein, partial [Gemmatimonadales bacterium]
MAPGIRQRMTGALLPLLVASAALLAPVRVDAQNGTITGRITDQTLGTPLEAARIVLSGTNRIETSDRSGTFTFRGVAPGSYQLRALRLGYRPAVQQVTLAEGGTATTDIAMTAAPIQLDEIVSTA